MAAPQSYEMLRETDPRVEYFHTEAVPGSKTSFAVWAPRASQGKLPVILFQSGHGSDMASQTPFLERLAAEGYLVIASDRTDDRRFGVCGLVGFLSGCLCSANAVDGSALTMALEFAGSPNNMWLERADHARSS